jgi:hypothetical protein
MLHACSTICGRIERTIMVRHTGAMGNNMVHATSRLFVRASLLCAAALSAACGAAPKDDAPDVRLTRDGFDRLNALDLARTARFVPKELAVAASTRAHALAVQAKRVVTERQDAAPEAEDADDGDVEVDTELVVVSCDSDDDCGEEQICTFDLVGGDGQDYALGYGVCGDLQLIDAPPTTVGCVYPEDCAEGTHCEGVSVGIGCSMFINADGTGSCECGIFTSPGTCVDNGPTCTQDSHCAEGERCSTACEPDVPCLMDLAGNPPAGVCESARPADDGEENSSSDVTISDDDDTAVVDD